jgi:hypothetical protein
MKKLNFGTLLLSFAVLVNLARWVGVYTFTDHAPAWVRILIPILDAISGLFTGLVIAGGLAFVSHRLGALQPLTPKGKPIMRFWMTALSGLAILVMSAFLLPPYVRMTMPDELRVEIQDLGVWSVMAVLVGDLIVVAIAGADAKSAGFTRSADEATGSGSVSGTSETAGGRSAKKSSRSAKGSKRGAGAGSFACPHNGAGCEVVKGTQEAINAHAGRCKFKPIAVMPDETSRKVEA